MISSVIEAVRKLGQLERSAHYLLPINHYFRSSLAEKNLHSDLYLSGPNHLQKDRSRDRFLLIDQFKHHRSSIHQLVNTCHRHANACHHLLLLATTCYRLSTLATECYQGATAWHHFQSCTCPILISFSSQKLLRYWNTRHGPGYWLSQIAWYFTVFWHLTAQLLKKEERS